MRRWQHCLALSFLASVVSLPAADAAPPPEQPTRTIVSGVLTDTADKPVPGGVDLFAWPTGRPVEVGQTVELLPVGNGRAARDGRFAIAGDLTPDLAELARLNGGYINFVLQAAVAGAIEETHFSRYVGDTPIAAQETGRPKRPTEWRASPEESAKPVRITVPEPPASTATPGDRRISPMQGGCWGLKRIGTEIGHTTIGELRAPADTIGARFVYGERADSEIGIAQRGAHEPWSLKGSFHIANSEDSEVAQRAASNEHLLVTGRFIYDKYEYHCPTGRREKVVPREWMGDIQSQPTAVRGCAGFPEDKTGRYGQGTEFKRDREKAVKWEGAVSVFGAALTARSGYSRWTRGHWKFGVAPLHVLCGDDGPPKRAGHIFAGTSG